jgi:hypothetical protein
MFDLLDQFYPLKYILYIAKKTDILLENNCKNECLIGLGICQAGLQGFKV